MTGDLIEKINLYSTIGANLITIITGLVAFFGIILTMFYFKKFLKRLWLKLTPASFNVAFSIDFKEGLNSGEYFKELMKNFNKIISDEKLGDTIKIKDFSDIYKFKNKEEAEKFRSKNDLDLIVWGDFSSDALKYKGEKVSKLNLGFTYCVLSDEKGLIPKMINADISSKLLEKNNWTIYENNSFNDVQNVGNNLSDMALYILSVSLKMQGDLVKSTEILEKHLNTLSKRNDDFAEHIKVHLLNNYQLFIFDAIFNISRNNKENRYQSGKKYCEKILKIYINDFFALSNLAYFEYNLGNKYKSKLLIDKIKEKYPKSPCSMINIAFFYLLDNKYKEAYKLYSQIYSFKIDDLDFNPIDVISFLSSEYEKTKNPGLLFASGLLGFLYGDKGIAKKDLSIFLKLIDKEKARLMCNKTEKILQYL